MQSICCFCNVYIASSDPEKVEKDGKVYHRNCKRRETMTEGERLKASLSPLRMTKFRRLVQ